MSFEFLRWISISGDFKDDQNKNFNGYYFNLGNSKFNSSSSIQGWINKTTFGE